MWPSSGSLTCRNPALQTVRIAPRALGGGEGYLPIVVAITLVISVIQPLSVLRLNVLV